MSAAMGMHDGEATVVLPSEAEAVLGVSEIESFESLRPRPLGATVGVWRVRGGDGSAIVKLLRLGASPSPNWRSSDDPVHPRWWRREPTVYRQGIPDLFEPELRPPRLLHVGERTDGSVSLWLEDLGQPASWTRGCKRRRIDARRSWQQPERENERPHAI